MRAIIPCAGEGKRMYPLTKYIPKAMLPVFGKMAIDYAINEALESQIDEIVVVARHQMLIDYVKSHWGIQLMLQSEPTGMDDAINLARPHSGRYAVLLPDVIFKEDGVLEGMLAVNHAPLTAIAKCPHGIVIPGAFSIEKPYWVAGRYICEGEFKNIPSHESNDYYLVDSDKLVLLENIYMIALGGYNDSADRL